MAKSKAVKQAWGLIPSDGYSIDVKCPQEGHFNATAKHVVPKVWQALKDGCTFIVKVNSCNWIVYEFSNGLTVKFHIGQLSEA